MRKLTCALLLTASVALAQERPILLEVNGQPLTGDAPIMQSGRVLVPLRSLFQGLGAEVKFEEATKKILAQRESTSVQLQLGNRLALVSGREVQLEVPAQAVQGRTYVPLRFVAEAFGAQVVWEGAQRRVRVTHGEALPPSRFQPAQDLKRIVVGHQAGILKVWDSNRSREVYHRGLDDRSVGRYDESARRQLLEALAIEPDEVEGVLERLLSGFGQLPAKEAVALMGALGSSSALSPEVRRRVQDFVARTMQTHADVVVRRQSMLALALMDQPLPETVEAVTRVFERTSNLWETFPVQQFFEYHSGRVRSLQNYSQIRQRLVQVSSLYTPYVLSYLDSGSEIRPRLDRTNSVGY